MSPGSRIAIILLPVLACAAASPNDAAVRQLANEVKTKGWIAFAARSAKGDWDLFLCRPDGSALRNITNTPDANEGYPQFSRDGRRLLYRRLARNENIDGNRYGAQGSLVIAGADGSHPVVYGSDGQYPWACWSPDGTQLACLETKGITIVDLASKRVVRTLERQGFFQQLSWSPDGQWFGGVSNGFGEAWSIARMNVATGQANAVSNADCCTPDWFPDSRNLIFSNRMPNQNTNNGYGWTQLWRADGAGKVRQLVYAEDGRHTYGGNISPDGKYVLFTGNVQEDGDPGNRGSPMALMRLADAPIVAGNSPRVKALHPDAHTGPVLQLPEGWEPCWTAVEVAGPASRSAASDAPALASELHSKGWIAYSVQTDQGNWDLAACRPDGSDRRNLTHTPTYNEFGVRFSPDGRSMLYYRAPREEAADNNNYGTFELVIARCDGANPVIFGKDYPWASWGPDSKQISCLASDGIRIVDLATRKLVRRVPRQGIVEQLIWSPDGRQFVGTANGLGPYWTIGSIDGASGKITLVSEADRYNCTPDWLPDSRGIVYSRGIIPEQGGRAELWIAAPAGRRLIYAEPERHIYGGCISPDGQYALFTRSAEDLGRADNSGISMSIIRLADAPMHAEVSGGLRRVDLGPGWEPHWTAADLFPAAGGATQR